MTLEIRRVTPSDAKVGADIQLRTWRANYQGLMPADYLAGLKLEEFETNWRNAIQALDESRLRIFVEEAGTPLGYLSAGPSRWDLSEYPEELFGIYVLPGHQGKGAGKALLRHYRDWLRSRGKSSFLLWTLKDNHPTRKFYEATGGKFLNREKTDRSFGSNPLVEVAYGWNDLTAIPT